MIHETTLAAKVAATNKANAYATKLHLVLSEFFKDYVGKRIEKVDGSLFKNIQDALPSFPETDANTRELSVYSRSSQYFLSWIVKTCETTAGNGCNIAHYHETMIVVGQTRDGVLEGVYPPDTYRDDYTVEEVLEKRKAHRKALELADELSQELGPFGEYDR